MIKKVFFICIFSFVLIFSIKAENSSLEDITASITNYEAYESMKSDAIDSAIEFNKVARLIAGLGALFYICTLLWKDWVNNRPIDFYLLLRPIIICFLIVFYSALPLTIETFSKPLVTFTNNLKNNEAKSYITKYKQVEKQKKIYEEKLKKKIQKEQGSVSFWDYLTMSFDSFYTSISKNINQSFANFLNWLSHAVLSCLYVFSLLGRIVLIIIGPLVLALSLFPYFKNSLQLWVSRYINLTLYVPVCNIVGYCNQLIYNNLFCTTMLKAYQQEPTIGANLSAPIFSSTLFVFVGIIMFCLVPKICGWVLDGQGSGLIGSAAGTVATAAGTAAAGHVGAGMAKVGHSGINFARNMASKLGSH